nr:MAG: hypothetical protein DIU57_18835 [Pseudomonadota bacterium]
MTQQTEPVPFSGISAMPSLHVAFATLVVLLAWQSRSPIIRAAGAAFAVSI